MTENKRFTITQDFEEHHRQIRDNGHIIMGCFIEPQAEVIVNLLNEQHEQTERLKENFRVLDEVKCELADENERYKSIFFELIETALTDKSCRELYCKGILDIFNKANSLNQAREMIKEHLE